MKMKGREIFSLIQQTAGWADKIGEVICRMEEQDKKEDRVSIELGYYELKSLEEVLIMAEDIIKDTDFSLYHPEEI